MSSKSFLHISYIRGCLENVLVTCDLGKLLTTSREKPFTNVKAECLRVSLTIYRIAD